MDDIIFKPNLGGGLGGEDTTDKMEIDFMIANAIVDANRLRQFQRKINWEGLNELERRYQSIPIENKKKAREINKQLLDHLILMFNEVKTLYPVNGIVLEDTIWEGTEIEDKTETISEEGLN